MRRTKDEAPTVGAVEASGGERKPVKQSFVAESTASSLSSATQPAKVVPLPRRNVGPAEVTRAVQIRQILVQRLAAKEPIAAVIVMATADGDLVTNHIGVAPELLADLREELRFAAGRLGERLEATAHGNVFQLRPVVRQLTTSAEGRHA